MSMQNVIGFGAGTSWGTKEELGANDGLITRQITGLMNQTMIPDRGMGQSGRARNDRGVKNAQRTLRGDMRYNENSLLRLFAKLFGTAGVPTDLTGAYQHDLAWGDDNYGQFGTLVNYNGVDTEESSAKVTKLVITSEAGTEESVQFNADVICDDVPENDSGEGVNSASTISSLTVSDAGNRLFHHQGVFRLNSQDGAALADGDELGLSKVVASFERPSQGDHTNQALTVNEPRQTGMAMFDLKLTFPEWTAAVKALVDDIKAGTAMKADLTWTGELITGELYYVCKVQLPRLVPLNPDDLNQQEDQRIAAVTLNFEPGFASSAPTGMPGITRPQMTFICALSTDPLA